VGSLTARKVNVRIVAATHRDLRTAIAGGGFREDLYYRLSMVELTVPALQERPEDVALLARHFVRKFSREFSKPVEGLTQRASIVLERYGWPGNVRELEHVIGRACMLTDGAMIDVEDLPEHLVRLNTTPPANAAEEAPSALAEQERRLLEEALRASGGNQSEAARRLKIGRDALRYKMKRYELSV
jgi:transcriptional regulator with PAS, ATPase and Fis domain